MVEHPEEYNRETCLYKLMEAAHIDEQASQMLLETLQGFTYMCQSLGCSAMKSYRGGFLEKSGQCVQNNFDTSPPRSEPHTIYVIGGEDRTYYD